jgi:hypothetical protein
MPMMLERTLIYIHVVLFAISLLLEQPVARAIASRRLGARSALGTPILCMRGGREAAAPPNLMKRQPLPMATARPASPA